MPLSDITNPYNHRTLSAVERNQNDQLAADRAAAYAYGFGNDLRAYNDYKLSAIERLLKAQNSTSTSKTYTNKSTGQGVRETFNLGGTSESRTSSDTGDSGTSSSTSKLESSSSTSSSKKKGWLSVGY